MKNKPHSHSQSLDLYLALNYGHSNQSEYNRKCVISCCCCISTYFELAERNHTFITLSTTCFRRPCLTKIITKRVESVLCFHHDFFLCFVCVVVIVVILSRATSIIIELLVRSWRITETVCIKVFNAIIYYVTFLNIGK